jgi:hypothetical protein
MTDYYQLIAHAVADLRNADEARRAALYECARAALATELSGLTPPLTESEITRERLSLEAAIREIEASATRRPGVEAASIGVTKPTEWPQQEPPCPEHGHLSTAKRESSPPATRSRAKRDGTRTHTPEERAENRAGNHDLAPLSAEALEALKVYRESVVEAERLSEAEIPSPERAPFDDGIELHNDRIVPRPRALQTAEVEPRMYMPPPRPPMAPWQTAETIARNRSDHPLKVAFLGVFVALAILLYYQGDQLSAVFVRNVAIPARPGTVRLQPEVVGSVGQAPEQRSLTADRTPIGLSQELVAQRAVLYEEDLADANGKRYAGSVIWRTELLSPGQSLAVRAQLEIPERRISMTMSLRPNTDKMLPASHTIEIVFKAPTDFQFGGISNVLGILMKEAEQARGAPLAVASVKITTGAFLIDLSATESDRERNRELLDSRSWFDIPIVYDNGRRAILAFEKGTPGEGAFKEAFAVWK